MSEEGPGRDTPDSPTKATLVMGDFPDWPADVQQRDDRGPLPRYEMPEDYVESHASLQFKATDSKSRHEFWLMQLPLEFDPNARLEWQLAKGEDGTVSGTCQNAQGQTYAFEEEPISAFRQAYTMSHGGSGTLTQCKRHITVLNSYQLPDRVAAAQAVGALLPSAEMPGLPEKQPDVDLGAPHVLLPDKADPEKEREMAELHRAHDMLVPPGSLDTEQQRKEVKAERKKVAKRAQEFTAANIEHRKLQRVADVPIMAPEMLQVTAEPKVISSATLQYEGKYKPDGNPETDLAKEYKTIIDKDGKKKKYKKRDGNVTVTTTLDF